MKKRFMAILAMTALIYPATALAQQGREAASSSVTMPEVVVTGTRTEERIRNVPANVSVITAEDIQDSTAKNVADLLRTEQGVVVRNLLGNGKTAQVDLRGFGESAPSNTLVLVDGRRVNEIDISGTDWVQIPLEQIERIEIVRGTGTVLYGDNAVGGVINIITKTPTEPFTAGGGVTLGSYDLTKFDAQAGGRYGKLAVSLTGSRENTDGYRENNDYQAGDVGGKLVFDATDKLSLNLSASYHEDEFGLPGALTKDQVKADRRQTVNPDDEGRTRDWFVKAGLDVSVTENGRFLADASYRERASESRFPDVSFPFKNDVDTDTRALTPRYVWDAPLFGRSNKLIAGVDLYATSQDAESFSGFFSPLPSAPTGLSKVDRDSYGLYVNDEFFILKNLMLTLGARYEKVKYDFDVKDLSAFPLAPLDASNSESENAFNAGLTYLFAEDSSVFARINRSFRFPLIDELVLFDFDTGQIVVNPSLKPQTGRHYEIGLRHHFSPQWRANISFFRAEIEDEIFFNRPTFRNENHPETLHQGVEVGAGLEVLSHVALNGSYTYQRATFEKDPYEGKDIPAVPRNKVNLGLKIFDILPGVELAADVNYVGTSRAVSDFENRFDKLDHYTTVDLKLSYEWKMIRAFAGVNNLTDEKYAEYAVIGGAPTQTNFYPAPERNYVVGLRAVF